MLQKLRLFHLFPALSILLGCAMDSKPPVAAGESSGLPVIVHIRTRDHVVTVLSGGDGPRYALATADGRVLETGMSIEEFEARHPSIYDAYKSSITGGDAGLRLSEAFEVLQETRIRAGE